MVERLEPTPETDRTHARRAPDALLIALLVAQRLLPIAALAVYVRGYRPPWLVGLGVLAWVIATAQAVRQATIARDARTRAVSDAAWGIARRSVARVRGGAHDGLLEVVWRGISARASLAAETEPSMIASAVAAPLAVTVALVFDGREAALATGLAALVGLAVRVPLARVLQKRLGVLHAAHRILAIDLGHGLRALEDLQAHGLAETYARRLEGHARGMADAESAVLRAARAATLGPLLAGSAVFVGVLAGTIGTPSVGLVHLATLAALGPIAIGLARGIVQRTQQRAEAAALDALASLGPDLAAPSSPVRVEGVTPIAWSHVTFRHPGTSMVSLISPQVGPVTASPGAMVFDDVSLTWDGASPLAIVGTNGSGKSTLVMLALRLVDPTEGVVTIGGVDLRQADPSALRPRIAYVPQRPLLLEGMSVGEAMRLVAPEANDARLLAALKRVGLAERLRTREGPPLDVPCATLSVGEAQRIAIARALARDAELLVLDEPEASLDPTARAELRELLEALAAEGKRIVIATQHDDVVPTGSRRLNLPLARGTVWPEPGSPEAG